MLSQPTCSLGSSGREGEMLLLPPPLIIPAEWWMKGLLAESFLAKRRCGIGKDFAPSSIQRKWQIVRSQVIISRRITFIVRPKSCAVLTEEDAIEINCQFCCRRNALRSQKTENFQWKECSTKTKKLLQGTEFVRYCLANANNTEISVTSLLLPAFSQMTINFEHADAKKCEKFNGGVQAVGLRGQPYIANEKIRPQQYQEEKKDVMSKALLKEMYIGCKTAEGAEKRYLPLLKPLPLYLLYTRSNREFLHKAVQAVDVVDSGVQVLVDASEDAEAATPFPNSSEMSVTSSISHTSSSSRNFF
uniref:Vitellogenin n=1 Tax=Ditylenchus dipsaci TaxID=166011 RepID=A0A915EGY8_9BILA